MTLKITPLKSVFGKNKQISKKVKDKKIEPKPTEEKENKTTVKQEIFCQEYVDSKGNGTRAALMAFDITDKECLDEECPDILKKSEEWKKLEKRKRQVENTAAAMATEYLRKPHIIKRIDEILDERGFTDEVVKREHFFLIVGAEDSVKRQAISDYYKLKGKFAPDKMNIFNYQKYVDEDEAQNHDEETTT